MMKHRIVAQSAFPDDHLKFTIFETGGLTVIVSPSGGLKTASLGVFVTTGSRYEKKKVKGIAHYLEHMLFKGTKNYSYKEIKRQIEGRGGILNGFTSQETTAYYSQFLNKNLYITLDILLDMVIRPKLELHEIEKERNVILEEIKMHNDLPHIRVSSLLDGLIWQGHPLGEEIIGSSATVRRIQKKDLIDFKDAQYPLSRMVVVCVGDCQADELLSAIARKTARFSRRGFAAHNAAPAPLRSMRVAVEKKELDQTHLCVGFRAPSYRSGERVVVDLIHVLLGANMSSRLFEEMREKRALCYDVSTEARKYWDSGAFIIHAGLAAKNVPVALKTILRQLRRISTVRVGAFELERAKDYLLGQVIMGLERPQGRMFYMADSYIALRRIFSTSELIDQVRSITPDMIRKVAASIFSGKKACISCVTNDTRSIRKQITDIVSSSLAGENHQ